MPKIYTIYMPKTYITYKTSLLSMGSELKRSEDKKNYFQNLPTWGLDINHVGFCLFIVSTLNAGFYLQTTTKKLLMKLSPKTLQMNKMLLKRLQKKVHLPKETQKNQLL